MNKYDCGGYVTRYNIQCSDGRTIKPSAFADQLPKRVPLMWQHDHGDVLNCLGHADLEARPDGVWGYVSFLEPGKSIQSDQARALVEHGSIRNFSIYANHLRENTAKEVYHGDLKEVSLVIAPANPMAVILDVGEIEHDDEDGYSAEIDIYNGDELIFPDYGEEEDYEELEHADDDNKKEKSDDEDSDESVAEVLDTLSPKQATAVKMTLLLLKKKLEEQYGGKTDMKKNVFDQNSGASQAPKALSHADQMEVLKRMRSYDGKSFKTELLRFAEEKGYLQGDTLAHADTDSYGIEGYEFLFPDAVALNTEPKIFDRRTEWVKAIMDNVTRFPAFRFKTNYADVTAEEARARGYDVLGRKKVEGIISLFHRAAEPTTIYKMIRLDKDVIRDITSFDVLKWYEGTMKIRIDEEAARAILLGDGRDDLDPYKIPETKIRPVYNDEDIFTIKHTVVVPTATTDKELVDIMVDEAVISQENYRGNDSNVMAFMDRKWITKSLLIRDKNNRRVYKDEKELALAMQVDRFVPCDFLRGLTRTDEDGHVNQVYAIIFNPSDYTVGTEKGSPLETFKQFDMDYNQEKILKETRMSGMLTNVLSAITLEYRKED